jgi:proteasome lid subunit RPN8/RPN11
MNADAEGSARMSDMLGVREIRVPRDVVEAIQQHLREAGSTHREGVAFWAGQIAAEVFEVHAALVPAQIQTRSEEGVAVMITGDELFRMNVWLHRNHMTVVAQLHSHPGEAYHSDTDNDYSIVTQAGGLSIVVPDFARGPFSLDSAAVYRLDAQGAWSELDAAAAKTLIRILD